MRIGDDILYIQAGTMIATWLFRESCSSIDERGVFLLALSVSVDHKPGCRNFTPFLQLGILHLCPRPNIASFQLLRVIKGCRTNRLTHRYESAPLPNMQLDATVQNKQIMERIWRLFRNWHISVAHNVTIRFDIQDLTHFQAKRTSNNAVSSSSQPDC